MKTHSTQTDNLAHIKYENENIDIDDVKSLRNQVSSTDGRIVIVAGFGCSLVLTYSVSFSGVNVSLVLETPVGNVTIGSGTLDASHPSITVGGSIGKFKAEATISFDVGTKVLNAAGEVCVPVLGCKKGGISLHL